MAHAQITTTQKSLRTLPDADTKNLAVLDRTPESCSAVAIRMGQLKPTDHRRRRTRQREHASWSLHDPALAHEPTTSTPATPL